MVAGFSQSAPNRALLEYAQRKRRCSPAFRVLDIGCGAGRNAVPLALADMHVTGIDLSWPMLQAAASRDAGLWMRLAQAPMHALPVRDRSIDLIVAHGIWNLAQSGAEFRRALAEAARVAARGAALFVFTFSRRTLSPMALPVDGESFLFTKFAGTPQVFLTAGELVEELRQVGFVPDPDLPIRELNVPPPGRISAAGVPVIYEAGFCYSKG